MASDPNRIQAVFLLAAESPSADRIGLLDRECGGDNELRHAVDSLLAAHERSGSFLDRPADLLGDSADFNVGAWVGPYKLVQKLGEGGMGAVWAAEQEQPVRRRVAVKLIKPGMDSVQVLRRFEAERQALALMDHPNIARILDAGVEPARRCPYFVMELVKGVPLNTYCDQLQLSVRERLGLFVDVCRAVQHAHQKGIVHRDLKPGNVLVSIPDGKPTPKVIDFGLAKALHQQLTADSLHTSVGAVVGTLRYMSPEQAELSPLDVDTRADVYALGVVLYELLTGTTPLDPTRLREAGIADTLKAIREEEPTRPSTRLSELKGDLASLAAQRRTDAQRLPKEVAGDLDWIVMKCLEKDRTRRYETVNALTRDVERFLADEPVEARPPSAGYRVRKFVRRNRRGVIAGGVVLAALVLGMAGTTAGMIWALKERDDKEYARRDAVQRQGQLGRANDLLTEIFLDLDPTAGERLGMSLRAVLAARLDRAAAALDGDVVGDPETVAGMQDTLGVSLRKLGYPARAAELHAKAARTHEALFGRDDRRTLASLMRLTTARYEAGFRGEAEEVFTDLVARQTAALGETDSDTLASMMMLARVYQDRENHGEAVRLFDRILKAHLDTEGENHPNTRTARNNLGLAYHKAGQPKEAIAQYDLVLAGDQGDSVADHLNTLNNRAAAYDDDDRKPEALAAYREIVPIANKVIGEQVPQTLMYTNNLAGALMRVGEGHEAVRLFDLVLRARRATLLPTHPDLLVSLNNLAAGYISVGLWKDARRFQKEAVQLAEDIDHPDRSKFRVVLCRILLELGEPVEALPYMDDFLAVERAKWGARTPKMANQLAVRGNTLLDHGQFAAAEKLLRECQSIREEDVNEKDAWQTFSSRALIGRCLLGRGNPRDAEPLMLEGYAGMRRAMDEKRWRKEVERASLTRRLGDAADALILLYTTTSRPDDAAKWREVRKSYPPEVLPPPRSEK